MFSCMRAISCLCRLVLPPLIACSADAAIDIIFDYSYDTGGYFTDERKYVMEQAAYAFESRLGGESFGSFTPADYGTSGTFYVSGKNPTTLGSLQVNAGSTTSEGQVIGQANEIVIFLGAKNRGSIGVLATAYSGYGYSGISGGTFMNYWNNTRNSSANFDSIGGSISVNTHYSFYDDTDLTSSADATSSGKQDFYSVMVHEIGHIMGFSNLWEAWKANKSSNLWNGSNGKAAYGGQPVPIDASSQSHFGSLTQGNVNCACHPSMSTSISANSRKGFSELDFAMLEDVGYSVSASPQGTNVGSTYTDPTWGGNYYIPVKETYSTWLANNAGGGGGVGGAGGGGGGGGVVGTAAPEPAEAFPLLGFGIFAWAAWRSRRGAKLARTSACSVS